MGKVKISKCDPETKYLRKLEAGEIQLNFYKFETLVLTIGSLLL